MGRTAANKNVAVQDSTVESVKLDIVETVNATENKDTVNATENSGFAEKSYFIVCQKMANKKIFGTTGRLIEFNSEGIANVDIQEALHFKKIPGYEVKES